MSQNSQLLNADNLDWSQILEPTQDMRADRAMRFSLSSDAFRIAAMLQEGKAPGDIWKETYLAKATGLPLEAVMEDPQSAVAMASQKALLGQGEELAALADPKKTPTLIEYFNTKPAGETAGMILDKPMWNFEATQRGFLDDFSHSLEMGDYQQERLRLSVKAARGMATDEDNKRRAALRGLSESEMQLREGEGLGDEILRGSAELLPQFRDLGINVVYRGTQGAAIGMTTGAAMGAAGGAVAGSIVPGAGTAVGGAAGAATGAVTGGVVGLKAGAIAGSAEHSYNMAVGEIYDSIEGMTDAYGNKIDPFTASVIAHIGALPMAGLDMVSLGKAMELIPGLDRFVNKASVEAATKFLQENPGVMAAVSRAGGNVAKAVGTEAVTEGLQEGVVILSEEYAKTTGHLGIDPITRSEAVNRMFDAGRQALTATLPYGVGGGAVRAYANRRIQQSSASAAAVDELHTLAVESETVRNAPDMAREYVQRLAEDGGIGELYVRPDAVQRVFFQTEEGIAAATEMGITPQALVESIAMDADIAIPMDAATVHILNNEQVYNELRPDMRTSPDIMTPREAEAFSSAEEGAASQMDREGFDFLDSIFSGLDEEIAANEQRTAMAAPYVQQLVDAGYSERQAQHLMTPFVANAEQMAAMFNQTPEEYLSQRFAGFQLTTPAMMNMTQTDIDAKTRRQFSRAPLHERDPLLGAIWGRLDPASIKDYDSQGAKELTKKYGRGLFKGKGKNGQALDTLADELVRYGLLPEGSGANELLAALQDRREKVFHQRETPEENARRGLETMNRVIAERTDALNAMYREDVGDISFYWGEPGKGPKLKGGNGIAHLIARREAEGQDGEAVARKIVEVLAYGESGPEYGPRNGLRRDVAYDGHTAVLSLYHFGKQETWLLTGWKDNSAGETDAVNAPSPTQTHPSGIRSGLGAAEPSSEQNINPRGADGKPLFEGRQEPKYYQYVGERSAMSQSVRDNLSKAQELAESGESNEAIRQETGWFKGMDGKWRYEIPDKLHEIDFGVFAERNTRGLTLGEVYGNDELYTAYPDLRTLKVQLGTPVNGERGSYNPVNDIIFISKDIADDAKKDSLLHEIQHAIQEREGFARGSSPEIFQTKTAPGERFKAAEAALDEFVKDKSGLYAEANAYMETLNLLDADNVDEAAVFEKLEQLDAQGEEKWGDDWGRATALVAEKSLAAHSNRKISPEEQYANTAGEIEARDTATRGGYNPRIRKEIKPALEDDAIIIFGGEPITSFSIVPRGDNARGYIDFTDTQAVINLFRGKKNLSTVIHEGGHFFLENLREAAQLENAPEWVRQAWQSLQQEYGFDGFELSEAVHERFAREFEAYARNGKAPSSRLQAAFRQFSNWLTRLYRSVRSLIGAEEISSDIRNVFDRLLATEEEIESARREGSSAVSLAELEANGLEVTPELRDRYARAVAEAQNKAAAAIAAQRMVEQQRMEKMFRAEAESRIAQEPFYRAEADVREQGGINWDSVLAFIDEDLAEEIRRKWSSPFTKGLFKDDGALGFTDVAAHFNADSPQNLAGILLSTPTRKEAVEAETQRAIAEWNRTFDGSMEYSNAMDAALVVELEALTGQKQLSGAQFRAELDRRIGVKKSSAVDAEYKALTQSLRKTESILREVMRDVRREAQSTLRQETKQAQADGVLAGEMHEGAKRAKERRAWQDRVTELKAQERAKRAALAAAYRARIEREKLARQIRKDAVSKSVNDAFRQQILAMVAHWRKLGTNSMQPRDIENTPPLRDFIAQHESLFGEGQSLFPEWLLAESNTVGEKSAGDLTLEQMRDVQRAVRVLAHQGRNYDRLLSFAKEVQITEAAGEMVASMNKMAGTHYQSEQERATFQGKARGLLRGAASEVTAMRYLFDALDGYVNRGGKNIEVGANHKYIVSSLQDAMGREQRLTREYSAKLVGALTKLARQDMRKSFVIEGVALPEDVAREWGGMFTHEKVLGVALNMGNEGNLRALKRGYGWSDADLQRITSRLTVAELQTVQELWDIINELYPVLNDTHQQLNGVPLSKVEAQEVTFQAADGEVTLPGGYFPLAFDHMLSRKAEEQQSVDELINRNESILRTPNPKSGMTKERTGGTLPPKLSLSVVRQHVADTIHYATHAPALRDVYRITQLPEYRNAFVRAAGLEAYNELTPWLRHIARPEGEHVTKIDRTVEWLAKRGTLFALAVNMKSAFLQLSSLGNSIVEVGGTQFVKGVFQMMSRPHSTFQEVKAKSAYMENRGRMLDASLKEWLDRFSLNGAAGVQFMGRRFTLEQVHNAQFAFIQGLDAAVAYPTWVAAYDAAVAAGMEEAESIRRADEAVIRAQGSGGAMDIARVLRKRGWVKLFTPFMSFALNDFNRKKYFVGGFREYLRGGNSTIDFKTFAQHFALEWVVPVVFSTMMLSLGRDGELPDTENYVWESLGFLTMGLPLVRDAVRAAEGQFTGKGFGSRMGGSVGYAGIESAMKAASSGYKWLAEDNDKAGQRFGRELINTMGFVFGIGTPQLWRTMDGSEAYFVNDDGGILAPFLGKPQKDKK